MRDTELHALTDAELHALARAVREEQEFRVRDAALKADLQRRREAIRAGKGDPGPAAGCEYRNPARNSP